ncbi:Nif11-like leader peptide family natural product precursor [Pseudomonas sp. 8 R 14]|uniref:Nif11-like leader peptide family natural product precursor n=1 Tax=Pseudomonas sp. 8 R 14 TaxID=1844092 RepID=UPI000811FFDB|nr:Nif11-like leader peptide family natural product precursor [Pseudomonas sp. 8 R 14]CRL98310.1 hypothetical protein [Pseudomonas sp. 8 R 14]
MSKENALAFLERLEKDEDFRKAIINARKVASPQSAVVPTTDEFVTLGFDIKDMHEAMYERGTNLSIDEIKEITGGAANLVDDKLEVIAFMHVYGVTKAEV